jgi:hypothetical protein
MKTLEKINIPHDHIAQCIGFFTWINSEDVPCTVRAKIIFPLAVSDVLKYAENNGVLIENEVRRFMHQILKAMQFLK